MLLPKTLRLNSSGICLLNKCASFEVRECLECETRSDGTRRKRQRLMQWPYVYLALHCLHWEAPDGKSIWIQAEMSSSTSRGPPGFSLWNHKSSMAPKQNFGGKHSFIYSLLHSVSVFIFCSFILHIEQFDRAVYKSHAVTVRPFLRGLILNMEMLQCKWMENEKCFIVLKEPRGVG